MFLAPVQMHLPNGFLSVLVAVVLWALTVPSVGYALKRVSQDLGERQIPLMGVLAAAIFAGQMLNFAVGAGTSGHLMGAALATILLGPWAAILVMTCVVAIQALIFQDGGLLVLGANLFNMGVVGVLVSHMAYRTARRVFGGQSWGLLAAGFIAAWLSIELAALAVALQLALSGISPANLAIPAMAFIHALIGVGEGLITVGALSFIRAARPDLLDANSPQPAQSRLVWAAGLLVAITLAVASPLASSRPDGLEWVAQQQGFLGLAEAPTYELIPDYVMPGVTNEALATALAGVAGVLIVFGAAIGVAYLRRNKQAD